MNLLGGDDVFSAGGLAATTIALIANGATSGRSVPAAAAAAISEALRPSSAAAITAAI